MPYIIQLYSQCAKFSGEAKRLSKWSCMVRGPPLEYYNWEPWILLEINIFVGKMGEINKWPQGMVEINVLSRGIFYSTHPEVKKKLSIFLVK